MWIEVRDRVQKAKFEGFKCTVDHYEFEDLSDEELEYWDTQAQDFLDKIDEIQEQEEQEASSLDPGFYLEDTRDGEMVGPYSSHQAALEARASKCMPKRQSTRDDRWTWARNSWGPFALEKMEGLREMSFYKIRRIKNVREES